jgi:hypothetical protein
VEKSGFTNLSYTARNQVAEAAGVAYSYGVEGRLVRTHGNGPRDGVRRRKNLGSARLLDHKTITDSFNFTRTMILSINRDLAVGYNEEPGSGPKLTTNNPAGGIR